MESPGRALRNVMAIGMLAAVGAYGLAQQEASGPTGMSSTSSSSSARPERHVLGPLAVGTVVDGFRLDRIDVLDGEAQLSLSRGEMRCVVGLGAPGPSRPPALVPFPDVYVWYTMEGGAAAPPTSLIEELVRALRAGGSTTPLHRQLADWLAR